MNRGDGSAANYDFIFIGASVICVIEAVYHSLCGKSVLMIERQDDIGGAWRPLELFGLHDVENAIHYFLPDPYAFDFMTDVLGWDVGPSVRKYRVFQLPVLGCTTLPYDNIVSRFVGRFQESAWQGTKQGLLSRLSIAFKDVISNSKQPSCYVVGGAPEILAKVRKLLSASNVKVMLRASIDRIYMNRENQTVDVSVGATSVRSKTIVFSHGSRISNLTSSAGAFPVAEKIHPRPAVHLLVRDPSLPAMLECIFTADPIIKYAHDVTRFAREAAELIGKRKVIVLALHKDVMPSESIYRTIFDKLKMAGMVGKKAALEDQSWWAALLPPLNDDDLLKLKVEFGALVEFIKTENFSRAIGFHATRWGGKIPRPGAMAVRNSTSANVTEHERSL